MASSLTLSELMIEMRRLLLEAIQARNGRNVSFLGGAFSVIEELALEKRDGELYKVAMRFHDASVDYAHDAEWKSDIPSEEEILRLFGIGHDER